MQRLRKPCLSQAIAILCLGLIWVVGCKTDPNAHLLVDAVSVDFPDCKAGTCEHEINTRKQFQDLAALVATGSLQSEVVKVVYRREPSKKAGRVYFINTKKLAFHHDFVVQGLGINISGVAFNRNYDGDGSKRNFNQASLVWNVDRSGSPRVLVELWSGDTLTAPFMAELMANIARQMKVGAKLVFHPLSTVQEGLMAPLKKNHGIDSITTSELFAGRDYIALNQGSGVGFLRFASGADSECFDQSSIVVFDHVPNDIGLYAGVVTAGIQTPLSHVNVKSINRGTINMYLKDAKKELEEFRDKPVRLTVQGEEFNIELLDEQEAQAAITKFWSQKRPSKRMQPLVDSNLGSVGNDFIQFSSLFNNVTSMTQLRSEHRRATRRFGAKATNLAMLKFLIGRYNSSAQLRPLFDTHTPDGFAVSFAFFDDFMNLQQKGLDLSDPNRVLSPRQLIVERLNTTTLLDHTKFNSICDARPVLADLREIIMRAEVPEKTLNLFRKYLLTDKASPIHQSRTPRIRLRSSTNSEDMEGFNGAGLYNSAGVSLYRRTNDKDEKWDLDRPNDWERIRDRDSGLRNRIRLVYSSVWNDRAYEEREWFRMNGDFHLDVKVGIAVHMAFSQWTLEGDPGEQGNGVAVSRNIYNPDSESPKFYFNTQHYDLAVTNPPAAEDLEVYGEDPAVPYVTEELLVTPFTADQNDQNSPTAFFKWAYERISKSSIKGGAPVLVDDPAVTKDRTRMEVRRLANLIDFLNKWFASIYQKPVSQFAVDTEFKIYGKNRSIWMKQARPFDDGNGAGLGLVGGKKSFYTGPKPPESPSLPAGFNQ
jgi:hypothetical protein